MSKAIDDLVIKAWRKLPPEQKEAEFLKAQDEIGALRLEIARLKEQLADAADDLRAREERMNLDY